MKLGSTDYEGAEAYPRPVPALIIISATVIAPGVGIIYLANLLRMARKPQERFKIK